MAATRKLSAQTKGRRREERVPPASRPVDFDRARLRGVQELKNAGSWFDRIAHTANAFTFRLWKRSMHQTLASVFAVLACLGGTAPIRAAEEGAFRLAAAVGGETLTQFAVDKRPIVSRHGVASLPVPDRAVWTLAGDLRAHADLFLFSPEYEIVDRLSTADADAGALLRYAIVRPRRRSVWTDEEVKGSVVVFVWLVDRKPVAVVPVASVNKGGVRPSVPPPPRLGCD